MRTGKVLTLLLVALTGCDRTDLRVYSCLEPDKGHKDANGEPDPCHRNDLDAGATGDAGGPCDGECVPDTPESWRGPALLWTGDEAAAPPCPENVAFEVFRGHGDPDAPITCGACKCAPPSGSCELPSMVTAAAASCAGDGSSVEHTSFNPPAIWGGTCTDANAIPLGKLCNGVPCVQSVTIAPLTLKQSECQPIEPSNVQTPPIWKTFARACATHASSSNCAAPGWVCGPNAPGPEFRTCIHRDGSLNELECPLSYPNRNVFYKHFMDERSCSPCTCGAPSGGTCTGSISIFQDSGCGSPLFATLALTDTKAPCVDLPLGSALGSKRASELIFTHGACEVDADAGAPMGKATSNFGTVFCCLETP